MSIEEQRARFEAWLESAGFDVRRYHHIDGYHGLEQQAAWEAWQAALDSVCVELPPMSASLFATVRDWKAAKEGADIVINAIHAAGVKTK